MDERKTKLYRFLAAAAVLALIATGCTEQKSGVLKVGVRADIMNFGYFNEETGKYYGLEIDIAEELARRLGYDAAEFVTVKPDNRKEMLLDGKVDCVIAAYSAADTRRENLEGLGCQKIFSRKVLKALTPGGVQFLQMPGTRR